MSPEIAADGHFVRLSEEHAPVDANCFLSDHIGLTEMALFVFGVSECQK